MVSAPSPPASPNLSLPGPPARTSLPGEPMNRSAPPPPETTSSPAPSVIVVAIVTPELATTIVLTPVQRATPPPLSVHCVVRRRSVTSGPLGHEVRARADVGDQQVVALGPVAGDV